MEFNIDSNSTTIELMRLFQDNVKKVCLLFSRLSINYTYSINSFNKDIVIANEIVDLVEKRMQDLYKDLESLKGAKNDINKDFNDYTSKIDKLSLTNKNIINLKTTASKIANYDSSDDIDENNNNKISTSNNNCHEQFQKISNEEYQQLMNMLLIKNVDENFENKKR
jgi:hypothetical protein